MWIYLILIIFFLFILALGEFLVWKIRQREWKKFSVKNGLVFHSGSINWRFPLFTQDQVSGTYRGRKLNFSYSPFMTSEVYAIWNSHIYVSSFHRPNGTFRIGSRRFTLKGRSKIGDSLLDKKVRIVKENPKGYLSKVIQNVQLRKNIYSFFSFPITVDREISLTAGGKLELFDRGIIRNRKKLSEAFDLLCDLAEEIDSVSLNENIPS